MNIKQNLEDIILFGHTPNFLILENIDTHFDVRYVLKTDSIEEIDTFIQVFDSEYALDISEATKLVYENVKNYIDPFDYTATKIFTESDNYHYMLMDVICTDRIGSSEQVTDIKIINGSLQINECVKGSDFLDQRLGYPYFDISDTPLTGYLNYDLNFDLH